MAVKRKNQKEKASRDLLKNAVKIKCCYCDLKDKCNRRANKEKLEKQGVNTYCLLTPNRPKSYVKKQKKKTLQ